MRCRPQAEEPALPPPATGSCGRWVGLALRLLGGEGGLPSSTHRGRAPPRRAAPKALASRWVYLHGKRDSGISSSAVVQLPRSLTLAGDLFAADCSAKRRKEELRRAAKFELAEQMEADMRKVLRLVWGALARERAQAKAAIAEAARVAEAAAAREAAEASRQVDEQQEQQAAAALGIDVATYRLLRQLEQRDICPEDYDLLGRLDEQVKPATLCREQLKRFPTETYEAAASAAGSTADGGGDDDAASFASARSGEEAAPSDDEFHEPGEPGEPGEPELCAICYVPFAMGDAVRRLRPCGHCFHKECIDRWLLESSKVCPVDKQELCC